MVVGSALCEAICGSELPVRRDPSEKIDVKFVVGCLIEPIESLVRCDLAFPKRI